MKKNLSTYTDEELLELYNNSRRQEYFGQLYSRYIPLLYGLCLKYLQEAAKAEDAVMQLFEDLMPKIFNYEIRIFRTWIYSVAKNHCLQLLRKNEREISVDFTVQVMESDEIIHLFEEEDNTEKVAALNRCLEKLPDPQRISILKFFMEEMSYTDIADLTGFQLKSVKSYIQNGKRNLKICIEKILVE
jgi:RNA polymerase sigma-70 factor (ECF subfamily)